MNLPCCCRLENPFKVRSGRFRNLPRLVLPGLFSATLAASAQNLLISEFLADNAKGLRDEDGDHPSWIELHNADRVEVDLDGWFLTDSPGNLQKWRLPSRTVPAGRFILVFASAKDRTNVLAPLHASFKLDPTGGFLALVKPDGVTVASEFGPAYPSQIPDKSYGLGMIGLAENVGPAPALDPASLLPYVHLRADAGVTINNLGIVTSWGDSSANAFVFKANHPRAANNNPKVIAGPAAGTFAIKFDGSDLIDSDANLQLFTSGNSGLVSWSILRPASIPGLQRFVLNHAPGAGGSSFEMGQDAGQVAPPGAWGIHRGSGNATSTGPNALAAGLYRLMTTEVLTSATDGTNVCFYTNGVLMPNAHGNWLDAGSYNTGSDPLAIGARVDNKGQGFNALGPDGYFVGDIAEIILLRGTLTAEERQGAESFLLNKYGLPAPNRIVIRPQVVPGQVGYLVSPTPGWRRTRLTRTSRRLLDVDDLTDFLILFVYVGNEDGPAKNYYADYERSPAGKWRFMPWDNEWCLGHSFSGFDKLDIKRGGRGRRKHAHAPLHPAAGQSRVSSALWRPLAEEFFRRRRVYSGGLHHALRGVDRRHHERNRRRVRALGRRESGRLVPER